MKVAVSTSGKTPESTVDPRFGRAGGFMVFDTDTRQYQWADNEQNLNLAQGAGIQAGMNVARTGAQAVVTGHVGPKAYKTLSKGEIAVYLHQGCTVAEAVEAFEKGEIPRADSADKDGHW